MRMFAICIHRKQSGSGENTSTTALRLQIYTAKFTAEHFFDPVVVGEFFIQHGVVRMQEIEDVGILPKHLCKQLDGFLAHGFSRRFSSTS